MTARTLSVVVAVQNAQQNLPEILQRLACERHPEVEFLMCFTDRDPDVPRMLPALGNVRALAGAAGSLIPHLWRDGIRAAAHKHVAIATAHCIPEENWLSCLLAANLDEAPGLGGVIENDPGADAMGWAIYLLRYVSFSPPQTARRVDEIAADNAVYRRADIVRHQDLLQEGFWEPFFHARFRAAGMTLAIEPRLRVTHRNRYTASQFFGQRLAHGRQFGGGRAASLPWLRRLLLAALSPILPLVFLRKIVVSTRQQGTYNDRLVPAMPWLCFFLLAWGTGEALGYLESLVHR